MASEPDPVVVMQGITKRFGMVLANDHVDFTLRQGEIHALLGENGAGKTTLMRILYGLYQADEGNIRVNDQPVTIASPKDAIRHGIGMVSQHFALAPPLTVTENVILGTTHGLRLNMEQAHRQVQAASDALRRSGRAEGGHPGPLGRAAAARRDPESAVPRCQGAGDG